MAMGSCTAGLGTKIPVQLKIGEFSSIVSGQPETRNLNLNSQYLNGCWAILCAQFGGGFCKLFGIHCYQKRIYPCLFCQSYEDNHEEGYPR
jgi:hypothetical protein